MKRITLHQLPVLVVASLVLLGGTRIASASGRTNCDLKIRVGRTATLAAEKLRFRFVRVANDSRCPKGVECVWAGNVEVLIEIGTKSGRVKKTLRLNTNASPERPAEAEFGGYIVKLVGVSPYPRAGYKIRPGEYVASLVLTQERTARARRSKLITET